jgi:hypothetical protein
MKVFFEKNSTTTTSLTSFTTIVDNEKIKGLIDESTTEIKISSSSRDLTLKERMKLMNSYNAYKYKKKN